MKNLTIIAALLASTSVLSNSLTITRISNDFQQVCIKVSGDGTNAKVSGDGTNNKVSGDGTNNKVSGDGTNDKVSGDGTNAKTYCQITSVKS